MKILFALLCLTISATPQASEPLIVRHVLSESVDDSRYQYYLSLLTLALDKTVASNGPYQLEPINLVMNQARAISQVKSKQIDVHWTMTSIERERTLSPVYFPLTKGLIGHRLLIIRTEDAKRFATIKTISQLAQLKAGQGHDWPDLKILRHNMLPTISSSSYEGLFGMLFLRRFDYFPRGVQEAWPELMRLASSDLMIEPNLMLRYPAPVYFFVHIDNDKLRQRIEQGLRLAHEDGSFSTLLYNYPDITEAIAQANMPQRHVLELSNPLLSTRSLATYHDKSLWYTPGEEKQYQSPLQRSPLVSQ